MSKYMYGVEYLREVDPNDEDHMHRRHRIIQMPSGPKLLPDAFDCILAKVCCLLHQGFLSLSSILRTSE